MKHPDLVRLRLLSIRTEADSQRLGKPLRQSCGRECLVQFCRLPNWSWSHARISRNEE
jgi:hypothetical protein